MGALALLPQSAHKVHGSFQSFSQVAMANVLSKPLEYEEANDHATLHPCLKTVY